MRSGFRMGLLCCLGFLAWILVLGPGFPCEAKAPALKVIKLRNLVPEQISATLRQTFGPRLRVAEIASINGVCLSSEDPDLVEAASALASELDQPRASLRYTIQTLGGDSSSATRIGVSGGRIIAETHSSRVSGSGLRTVTGMDGQEVGLIDEQTQIREFQTPWGPQTHELKHQGGLRVRGRLVGEGEAVIEVRYGEGGIERSNHLLTQLRVRLGEWIPIGGAQGSRSESGQAAGSPTGGYGGGGRETVTGQASYLLKVERIP